MSETPQPSQEAPAPSLLDGEEPGRRAFGRYELLLEMGQGGMAVLHLARIRGPVGFERLVAIKRIHRHLAREEEFVKMFLDEARIAATIHHPNVAAIYDLGQIDGQYFIAMEYIHGQSLTDVLKAAVKKPDFFPWYLACQIVAETARGLHAAHTAKSATGQALNVVHRDVSPSNVLVSYDGFIKLVDFGVAFAAEKLAHTATGTLKGKVSYMSPEQTLGLPVDRRSDIFSLGVVLYESITRKRLFKKSTEAATLLAIRDAEVPPLESKRPGLPGELQRIVDRALAKNPDDRYQTAQELADELEELLLKKGHHVGQSEISHMMEEYFHDKRLEKEARIQAAQKAPLSLTHVPRLADESSTSLSQMASLPQPRTDSKNRILLGIGLGALVLVSALGIFVLSGRRRNTRKSETPMRARPAAHAMSKPQRDAGRAEAKVVEISFNVTPADVPVTLQVAGRTYKGRGIIVVPVPRSNSAVTALVSAPSRSPMPVSFVPNQSQSIKIGLPPRAVPSARKQHVRPHRQRPMGKKRRKRRARPQPRLMEP